MRALLCCGLAAVLFGAWSGCHRSPTAPEEWLARVGTVEIRASDVQAELDRRRRSGGTASATEVLEDLVTRQSYVETARQRGLDRDPELQRAWENLLIAKLKEREFSAPSDATRHPEGDPRRQSEPNRPAPAEMRLAILKLRADRFMSDERRGRLRAQLEDARRRAAGLDPSVRDFGALAAEYSEDPASRYRGGDVGWMAADPQHSRWETGVTEAGVRLAHVGAISDVVEGREGFYLVRLMDRRSAVTPAESQVEPSLGELPTRQQRREREQAFAAAARREASATIARDRVAAFEASVVQHIETELKNNVSIQQALDR